MNLKKILSHVLIRIAILVLSLGSLFLIWSFTYDPHKLCDGDMHRHVDGGLGLFFLMLIVIMLFYLGLIIEIFYLFEKGKGNLALVNIIFLIINLCLVLPFIFLMN